MFRTNLPLIIKSIASGTVFFATYIELAPGLGNIWYRIESDGIRRFSLTNLFNFMAKPLFNLDLWNISLLDTNYISFITIWCFGIGYFINKNE